MQAQLFSPNASDILKQDVRVDARHLNRNFIGLQGLQATNTVPGLMFLEEFLTSDQQAMCVQQVDAAVDQWRYDLSRRVSITAGAMIIKLDPLPPICT